jgi:hypothetical protein
MIKFHTAECQGCDVISALSAGHSTAVRGVQTGGTLKQTVNYTWSGKSTESQWRNGTRSTPVSNARGSGFEPHQEQGFSSLYEAPNYLGLVNRTSFAWDYKLRSNVCTHSKYQARTIKILQSLCKSHKIVESYRNQHATKFSKGKTDMMRQWQHWSD